LNEHGDTNLNWIYFFRTILNECGFTYIWETEHFNNKEWLKCAVKQRFNLYNLPILRTSYIALSALSARCFLGTSELHVFVKITPK
jgi:hypothetical protein